MSRACNFALEGWDSDGASAFAEASADETARSAVDERVFGAVGEGVQFEVDVQVRPAEVAAVEQLDLENVADTGFLEPREILVGQEVFAVLHPEPNAVGGDVGDFNLGSASCWTHGD